MATAGAESLIAGLGSPACFARGDHGDAHHSPSATTAVVAAIAGQTQRRGRAAMRVRTRDVLLPILLYPITVPVIIAGVRGTAALLASPPDVVTATMWLAILLAFDAVFVTLALSTFEVLMTE